MFVLENVRYAGFLDIPEMVIEKGRITTLFGPSGCGKTTLLRLLNKLISPDEGRVIFDGRDLDEVNSVELRRKVVMLSQNPVVFPGNLRDNLNVGLAFRHEKPADDSRLRHLLEQVKLEKDLGTSPVKFSGGEKQRMALARVILLDPEVYLLDEPSSSLDEDTAGFVHDMLVRHAEVNGKTMIMVTHSRMIAERYSHVIVRVSAGGIIGRELCR